MKTNLFELNDVQQKAVYDTDGAILVIAGAGSGKTRVLTARIANLIDKGINPYNILAITFTNKAANEMKERISCTLGYSSDVWTSTFHSMCAKMLRFDVDRLGYEKNFSIYTDLESTRVVKRICKDVPESNPKQYNNYLWHISRAKTYALDPAKYYEKIKESDENAKIIAKIYYYYEQELKKSNALDFDDLIVKTIQLFEENTDVLEKYQNRFKYIHVDEFQDTNTLQYKLVKMLSAKNGNLFVVGDEDQSIYSWRGAEIKNILNFPKDFKSSKVYKLEQNYRSTTSILNAANNVIKNNSERNEKALWSENNADNSIEYYEASSDRDEAAYVARQVNYLKLKGEPLSEIAVLVRANALTRVFEEEFNLHGFAYKIFGGFKFFERKEIKDVLGYVRMAVNPSDNDSVLRTINYPKRGIGNKAVSEIAELAQKNNLTYFTILTNPQFLSPATAKKVKGYTDTILDLIQASKKMGAVEFMNYVISRSGIENSLITSEETDDKNRYENIQELVNAVTQFMNDNKDAKIDDFMQSVALVSDTDKEDDKDCLTIATIHAVKGLEFDNVFMIGLEENIFPTTRAINGNDVEEERRLMYVAITRARKQFYAVSSRSRFRFGRTEYFPKSRFVFEMKNEKQSMRLGNAMFAGNNSERRNDFEAVNFKKVKSNIYNESKRKPGAMNSVFGTSSKKPSINFDQFQKNTIVEHAKFGRGIIIQTNGDGDEKTASIAFKGLGVKRFSLAVASSILKIVKE